MDINEKLNEAGLTGNESRVYLELVKKGELSANNISKNLSMDRTLVYTVLNHLMEKGMVSSVIKEGKKFFSAEDPSNLLNSLKKKEAIVSELVGELKSIKREEKKEYEVKILEGRDSLRTIFNLFRKHNHLLAFGATGKAYDFLYESPLLVKELTKLGLSGRIITSGLKKSHPMHEIKGLEIKHLDIESDVTTSIFDDYVLIHQIKEKPFALLIKNKDIAKSYKSHFEVLWKTAKAQV